MEHTDLLHRFFDEGLDEALEDVLFARMASDAELRRGFLEHLRLHSIIQEDAAGITTPSHVSQELFLNLGLTPPDVVDGGAPAGFRKQVAVLALGLRSFVVEHQRYFYTAALSSIATVLLIFGLDIGSDKSSTKPLAHPNTVAEQQVLSPSSNASSTDAAQTEHSSSAESPAPYTESAGTGRHGGTVGTTFLDGSKPVTGASGSSASNAQLADMSGAQNAGSQHATQLFRDGAIVARAIVLNDIQPTLPEEHVAERRWHFFQPGPRTNLLSNMVFELQKLYGASFPSVDLPHNSHNVFENMALSAMYKVTEHHAFGFEYGREQFGREYQSTALPVQAPLDVSVQEMFTPPPSAMTVHSRDNRMLDVFGAVWKLSLPDYGIEHIVYPYMRTFVGATRLGPLGKVRFGLEMYPSNFSALNIGLEGGLFRYTEEDAAYYTTKLNLTLGVAIGF